MGKEPDQIREEIEETRAHMGETVEAIGYKANVKTRVKDSITDRKNAVVGAVTDAADAVTSKVAGVVPDRETVKQGTQRGVGIAKQNPLGLAIGGAALGFLAGLLLPPTRTEDRRVGETADRVKEVAKDAGQEALERGKQVAQEAGQQAVETVQERGQEESEALTTSLRERAQEVGAETSGS